MARAETLMQAATDAMVFGLVLNAPPSEFTKLPAFAVGASNYRPDARSTTFYEVPGVYLVYLAQLDTDGEAQLDALRRAFLTKLFELDNRWTWGGSTRAVFIVGGKRCMIEEMRLEIQEQITFRNG